MTKTSCSSTRPVTAAAMTLLALLSSPAWPHCDTLEGPVVEDARKALEQKDVTVVFKWVSEEDEAEIRDAFERTMAVRGESEAVRELADYWFFETLVRVHRATEGYGYTGLRSIDSIDPALVEADRALERGSADELIAHLIQQVDQELRDRYEKARERREHKENTVEQGREYVASYVQFVHYIEAIREAARSEHFAHDTDEHAGDKQHD